MKIVRSFVDGPTQTVLLAIVILLFGVGIFYNQFLSPSFVLQQLHNAAFLGIIAAGAMVVIVLGHIDLSVPWTITASATFSTAFVGSAGSSSWGEVGWFIGFAIGICIGLVNGVGVAYLRVPSMIWTLAVNTVVLGACLFYDGIYNLRNEPSRMMSTLGSGKVLHFVPNSLLVWLTVSAGIVFVLRRTVLGRYVFAVGTSESAAYLSGINTYRVVLIAYIVSGLCSATAGMMLAGYAGQSYPNMGDPYLLPGIAAVVLGGTSILGGRGSYAGTMAGVLLLTLISSILSVMQAPEAIKQISYGVLIIVMVGIYSCRPFRRNKRLLP